MLDESTGERRTLPPWLAGRVEAGDRVVIDGRSWLVVAEHGDQSSR